MKKYFISLLMMAAPVGGQLVVDGGTMSNVDIDLKAGAALRIINGGIIETRNDFVAPVGAIVDITHGEITKFVP